MKCNLIILMGLLTSMACNANSLDSDYEESMHPQEIEFRQCVEDAYYDLDSLLICNENKAKAWDKALNQEYSKAKTRCDNTDDPKKCRADLLTQERGFIALKENFIKLYQADSQSKLDNLRAKEVEANFNRAQTIRLMGFLPKE